MSDAVIAELRGLRGEMQSLVRLLNPARPEACSGSGTERSGTCDTDDPFATFEARLPAKIIAQYEADQNKSRVLQSWGLFAQFLLLVATAGAFVAAAYYAHIARLQRDTMERQFVVMDKQRAAMDNTLIEVRKQTLTGDMLARQIKGSQEARIRFMLYLSQTEPLGLGLSVTNYGQVSATHISGSLAFQRITLPQLTAIGNPFTIPVTIYDLGPRPGPEFGPEKRDDSFSRIYPIPNWTRRALDDVLKSAASVNVRGRISYDNGFGDRIEREFCLSYLREPNNLVPCVRE